MQGAANNQRRLGTISGHVKDFLKINPKRLPIVVKERHRRAEYKLVKMVVHCSVIKIWSSRILQATQHQILEEINPL